MLLNASRRIDRLLHPALTDYFRQGCQAVLRDLGCCTYTSSALSVSPCFDLASAGRRTVHASAASHDKPLFDKILVANRGEIAVRIMRTAKRMGIRTVAVYSEADKEALHVRYADEAVCIGPPPSSQSYLNVDAIVDAVRHTGAQCVHPGYGFLSENTTFAARLQSEGIVFVGPPASAIAAMGDKVESKRIAVRAGVNTIPGWVGDVRDVAHAVQLAEEVGFPAMIKASAGGGGKGMRIVRSKEEVEEGFELCVQEAMASFGDSRMLIERFIEEPRHIEIQLLGDQHGSVLWLPERECSIQRRNQKVVEEAPSTFVTPELRKAMGEQAVALAKEVGYFSAGTLEFLVDKHRNFYFLEMNTRLQVEHPVTEHITGLDLVEQMLRVAKGLPLDLRQEDVSVPKGWAVECRMYAEDPAKGFMPSIGRLSRYIEPEGYGVRVDSGVREGSEISVYYDPMIGKLVTYGQSRDQALDTMERALDGYVVRGIGNNLQLLRSVVGHPAFREGDTTTAFLAQQYPQIFESRQQRAERPFQLPLHQRQEEELLALAALLHLQKSAVLYASFLPQWMAQKVSPVELALTVDGEKTARIIRVQAASHEMGRAAEILAGALQVEVGDSSLTVAPVNADPSRPYCADLLHCTVNGSPRVCQVLNRCPTSLTLQYCGAQRTIRVQSPALAQLQQYMPPPRAASSAKVVTCPMAGSLISLAVAVGDEVLPRDDLAVVEAMKMRNVIKSEVSGRVKGLKASAGDVLKADQVILEFE